MQVLFCGSIGLPTNENPNSHLLERAFSISKCHNSIVFLLPLLEVFENLKYWEHPYSLAQTLGKIKEIMSFSILSLTFSLSHPRPLLEKI